MPEYITLRYHKNCWETGQECWRVMFISSPFQQYAKVVRCYNHVFLTPLANYIWRALLILVGSWPLDFLFNMHCMHLTQPQLQLLLSSPIYIMLTRLGRNPQQSSGWTPRFTKPFSWALTKTGSSKPIEDFGALRMLAPLSSLMPGSLSPSHDNETRLTNSRPPGLLRTVRTDSAELPYAT